MPSQTKSVKSVDWSSVVRAIELLGARSPERSSSWKLGRQSDRNFQPYLEQKVMRARSLWRPSFQELDRSGDRALRSSIALATELQSTDLGLQQY